jgi:hypothetical protein
VSDLAADILMMSRTTPTEGELAAPASLRLLAVEAAAAGWLDSLGQDRGDAVSTDLVRHILEDILARARGLELSTKPERVVL